MTSSRGGRPLPRWPRVEAQASRAIRKPLRRAERRGRRESLWGGNGEGRGRRGDMAGSGGPVPPVPQASTRGGAGGEAWHSMPLPGNPCSGDWLWWRLGRGGDPPLGDRLWERRTDRRGGRKFAEIARRPLLRAVGQRACEIGATSSSCCMEGSCASGRHHRASKSSSRGGTWRPRVTSV